MPKPLGLSVYVSTFTSQLPILEKLKETNSYIFTSFHITEELDDDYVTNAKNMCSWLHQYGFHIIADVSPKTLEIFAQPDLLEFAEDMKVSVLRLDYGFDEEEIKRVAKQMPIAFNASTLYPDAPLTFKGHQIYAMHNFYPRPETGLDWKLFATINLAIKQNRSPQVVAFIPGDGILRGPIYEGLPTLERHRGLPPYVAYLDLIKNSSVDQVFIGDVSISDDQLQLIEDYRSTGVIALPVQFASDFEYLYDHVYTIRVDSPSGLMRLQESRSYASQGKPIKAQHCTERNRGSITIDNEAYKRYSGEIQIMREHYPKDERVNVIGKLSEEFVPLVDCVKNGDKIRFVHI
ncbi:MupG family TIM beta-alpha barrel fold protein [Gracilibacillus caseinilyticus]|uniref:MupG family TIM beta-alpha barrel fold protein n=1 Tax=Gracilibacillus caseinilyticus TaxID=2932256 RepID=A0ABY4EYP1_9BACI|nr:MupG family TIM beta-alpha barrel fold protein [Gracilibacillus caseinilyticus]UOQ49085.1 MupG family TIM beta-alpha barrel fold protein [Gracilibacillus caseinilyticus]